MTSYTRSPLKYAGSKFSLLNELDDVLPHSDKLIEPFIGSAAVFVNMDRYDKFLINDINPDLIAFYKHLRRSPKRFIKDAKTLFCAENNQSVRYYQLRDKFNVITDTYERALLFLYFNRHGYNGLCRYNLSGGYNVPFGKYKKPYFPEHELAFMAKALKKAQITCGGYQESFRRARQGQVIYADSPYVGLSSTANFTSYHGAFGIKEQRHLVQLAESAAKRGVHVVLSNHDTPFMRDLYRNAKEVISFSVRRSISRKGNKRENAPELIAIY